MFYFDSHETLEPITQEQNKGSMTCGDAMALGAGAGKTAEKAMQTDSGLQFSAQSAAAAATRLMWGYVLVDWSA